MERKVGTVSRGIRCPIIRQGDDLVKIVVDSVLEAAESEKFDIRDRDVVAITESIVARSQGNYAETIGVIFPILSRNRFSTCLKGISLAAKKIILMLSFPRDEVGNQLLTEEQLDEHHIDPYQTVLSLEQYRALFGENKHPFTGIDYVNYYKEVVQSAGAEVEFVFANQAKEILKYTDKVINCDIHTRRRTKRILIF